MTVTAPPVRVGGGVRLLLSRASAGPAAVDGSWRPRSRDLAAELVPLLDELQRAGHVVRRVTYDLHAWEPAARRLTEQGVEVRLNGFHLPRPETVRLSAAGSPALLLAVVDPGPPDPVVPVPRNSAAAPAGARP
jgi:hypothetical protein